MSFVYVYHQTDFISTSTFCISDMQLKLKNMSWINSELQYVNSNSIDVLNLIFVYDLVFTNELKFDDKKILDNFVATYTYQALLSDVCLLKDSKLTGVNGGTFIQNIWTTRVLNDIYGLVNFATLTNNQITITVPGYYYIYIRAPASNVQANQIRLRNINDNTYIYGTNAYSANFVPQVSLSGNVVAANGNISFSEINNIFIIKKTEVFEVEHICACTSNDIGFGLATGFGVEEIYTSVIIQVITRF